MLSFLPHINPANGAVQSLPVHIPSSSESTPSQTTAPSPSLYTIEQDISRMTHNQEIHHLKADGERFMSENLQVMGAGGSSSSGIKRKFWDQVDVE